MPSGTSTRPCCEANEAAYAARVAMDAERAAERRAARDLLHGALVAPAPEERVPSAADGSDRIDLSSRDAVIYGYDEYLLIEPSTASPRRSRLA